MHLDWDSLATLRARGSWPIRISTCRPNQLDEGMNYLKSEEKLKHFLVEYRVVLAELLQDPARESRRLTKANLERRQGSNRPIAPF